MELADVRGGSDFVWMPTTWNSAVRSLENALSHSRSSERNTSFPEFASWGYSTFQSLSGAVSFTIRDWLDFREPAVKLRAITRSSAVVSGGDCSRSALHCGRSAEIWS